MSKQDPDVHTVQHEKQSQPGTVSGKQESMQSWLGAQFSGS